jgi:hypothetical protein
MKHITITLLILLVIVLAGPSYGQGTQPPTTTSTNEPSQKLVVDQFSCDLSKPTTEESNFQILISADKIIFYTKQDDGNKRDIRNTVDLTGIGSFNVMDTIQKYLDRSYPLPDVPCEKLEKLCKGNLSLFWGDVCSVFRGESSTKTVSGKNGAEVVEKNKNASLLITRGWSYDCKTHQWTLQLFFQYQRSTGLDCHFYKDIRQNVPCVKKK